MSEAVADLDALIGAYLRERAGLARRGATDRVAQVDAELARLGYVGPASVGETYAPTTPPRSRKAPPRVTAAD